MKLRSRRTRLWFDRIRHSKHMLWMLGLLSFLETIIIPVPIEVILIPLMAIDKRHIWALATVTTAGCLLASIVGYAVGMALYESVGTWFIETMGMQQGYESFQTFFDQYGFIAILAVGIIPIPFQVAMVTAGLSGYPIHLFVLAALIARGIRYYGLGWLVYRFGDRALHLWQRHAIMTSIAAAIVMVGMSLALQALGNAIL